MKNSLGIVTALTAEASALIGKRWQLWDRRNQSRFLIPANDSQIIISISGIGNDNALHMAQKLIAEGVQSLASVGLAGGLNPGLAPGHIVLASDLLFLHNKNLEGPCNADPDILSLAYEILSAENFSVQCGTALTTSQGILTNHQKRALFRETKALTVDMESAVVARAASEAGIPFFCLRVVCDPAETNIPKELSMCLDTLGNIQITSVLGYIARRPSLLIDLIHLTRCFKSAMPALKNAWGHLMKNNLPKQLASRSGK